MAPAATGRCRCHGLKQNYHTRCPLIPVASGVASGTGSALPPSKVAFFTARCCIGHRERMGLDSPITIRGRPLLESSGHRAGGAAGHQMGGQTKVFPIVFALESPSIGSRTALGPHLRRSCAPLRRPRGGRLERRARLECMLRRRVRTAEPCLLRKSHAARDAVTCKCRVGCLPDQSFLTSPAP